MFYKRRGQLVEIQSRNIYPATINIRNGIIDNVERTDTTSKILIVPGLIGSHIYIESSMIKPGAFTMKAVKHGNCAVVQYLKKITNVLGSMGVEFMIYVAKKVPLKFYFDARFCVPEREYS